MGRVMISGTGSGCGKTTITCAIAYGLKKNNIDVSALKCGPDYIDPMFHRKVLGLETGNLDSFFCEKSTLLKQLNSKKSDITIIEGAMGYFDGIGITTVASSYDIASMTQTPVILIINGSGMCGSILAVLDGFLQNDMHGSVRSEDAPAHLKNNPSYRNIKGVIINNISKSTWKMLEPGIRERGVIPVGYFPKLKTQSFESRHLGLLSPSEIADFEKKIADIYEEIRGCINWYSIIDISREIPSSKQSLPELKARTTYEKLKIAVARDDAFSFYYDENISELQSLGCEIQYFSPLTDKELPKGCKGLILHGGYPELFLDRLTANKSMRLSIKKWISSGLPTIAECGGFMYLQKSIQGSKMVGIFNEDVIKEDRLRHFGYVYLSPNDGENIFGREKLKLKAHEFHYYHMNNEGSSLQAKKASGSDSWDCAVTGENIYAGFPHIYFPGNKDFVDAFLERCNSFTGIN